jgi:ABC-type phosphate transport system substrate-binding protein
MGIDGVSLKDHRPHRRHWLGMPFLLLACIGVAAPTHAATAVIINAANTVDSISHSELKQVYKGDLARWNFASTSKQRVMLIDCKGKFDWAKAFYKNATGMSTMRLRTQWFGMVFRGEMPELPKAARSVEEIVSLVGEHAGAIGFVDAAAVKPLPKNVKILQIDSKGPGDQGYLFP